MVTLPPAIPVIAPVEASALAMAGLLLVQVPPETELLTVTVDPSHTTAGPVIVPGNPFTVTPVVMIQPADDV